MSEANLARRFENRRVLLASGVFVFLVGIVVGTFLFAPLLSPRAGNPPSLTDTSPLSLGPTIGSYIAGAFDSRPQLTVRLIQAIGILLPLFTGLLRLTTGEQSAVDEEMSDNLLGGIMGLVVGGVIATLGGIFTTTAGVLKVALLFVLLTFGSIRYAAIKMFGEMSRSPADADGSTSAPQPAEAVGGDPSETETESDPDTADSEPRANEDDSSETATEECETTSEEEEFSEDTEITGLTDDES